MWNGKMKAVTFSYDDGITQDQRLMDIFNRYGLKCTFNLNSGTLGHGKGSAGSGKTVPHVMPRPEEIREVYRGHEVAAHTVNHPHLLELSDEDVIREVDEDVKALSALVGYPVVGMAYPYGPFDDRIVKLIRENTDVKYARGVRMTCSFDLQEDLLRFQPTVHHEHWKELFDLARQFIDQKPQTPQLFYIWGHSYEFDQDNSWAQMEELCRLIAGHDDIFYGTNSEVFLDIDHYKQS